MTERHSTKRKPKNAVKVGDVVIGGDSPIVVQSMTNTPTKNASATLDQVHSLHESGCQLVRVSVPDKESARSLTQIVKKAPCPIIADIHFDHELALRSIEAGAQKIRINPGNINSNIKVDKIIAALIEHGTAVRIGVNSGSLERELFKLYSANPPLALAKSAEKWTDYFTQKGVERIVVSIKSSSVPATVKANEIFSKINRVPLHLGITESGTVRSGTVFSSVGLGILLHEGIGDTIRVSLSGDPVEEVFVAKQILASLGLYDKLPRVIACPTCARCTYDVVNISKKIEHKLLKYKSNITVAVMGCQVNGPGEAKEADIGIAGGKNYVLLFKKGVVIAKIPKDTAEKTLWQEIKKIIT
ncbi:flavodoxin-dependent (E)-4-hydroxy-3-methylbut-2-enyl-diphosphate synthase [candidate division WOR-3 bacterium]|nr:flavodoxin-dependent (E)-4-hydroxy-3-methylbut-2-enyl-diphosphate synthase [candidate division WOR-3 bacterium]